TSWETPLGKINLKKIEVIKSNKRPHINEHSIEVQLPFVQFISQITKQEFGITPICVGEITKPQAVEYAKILSNIDNSFFIVSTDLSHFLPYEEATAKDKETIKKIINKDYEGIDACGIYPLMIIIEIAKLKNWSFKLLNYSTSAETNNDKTAVVGYASFLF
ncbi:MAG: AmmeMemoRadiSam system protein B, partial [Candidatus Woesearchaeota archaeon]